MREVFDESLIGSRMLHPRKELSRVEFLYSKCLIRGGSEIEKLREYDVLETKATEYSSQRASGKTV